MADVIGVVKNEVNFEGSTETASHSESFIDSSGVETGARDLFSVTSKSNDSKPSSEIDQEFEMGLSARANGGTKNGPADVPESAEFTRLRTHFYGDENPDASSTKSFVTLGMIFGCSLLLLFAVYLSFPQLENDEKQFVKLPKNIEDAKKLGTVLSKYKDQYYIQVLVAYFTAYVFLQSFAIPGSIFLSILSGFLFPFSLALFLVCLCSATGASFCYLLSYLVGRRLVWRYIPERAIEWSGHVQRHRQHLLNYIVFLRITPFLPNWFINITSPVINVPLSTFFIGTFLGVAPPSFVAIQAGTTLQQLTSSGDTVSWQSISILAAFAIVSLLPVIFRSKLKQKFD